MYAIGGSANPTILSEGNFYVAPNDPNAKQVEIQQHELNLLSLFLSKPNTYILMLQHNIECCSWMTGYQEGSEGKLEELEMEVFQGFIPK